MMPLYLVIFWRINKEGQWHTMVEGNPNTSLTQLKKFFDGLGEICAPSVAWTEYGQPLPYDKHEEKYLDTLPFDLLFHCDCQAGSHKLKKIYPYPYQRRERPTEHYIEIHADFYKRGLFAVYYFFVLRCPNNTVSVVQYKNSSPIIGKVIRKITSETFELLHKEELNFLRSSKGVSDYRYLWPKPVVVDTYSL